jgi:hypothetical protein
MNDFSFISDDVLRKMIERDKKELDTALESGLCKATMVLAGSLIEAVLVDYFKAFPPSVAPPKGLSIDEASLHWLINTAKTDGAISERAESISIVVKDFRNLIHPGREHRRKEKVDYRSASITVNLIEMIFDEIRESYIRKLGYTAQAAIAKVRLDPSCKAILSRMVEQMSEIERLKLLVAIPEICEQEELSNHIEQNFLNLHSLLAKHIPETMLKAEVQKICEYLDHRSSAAILHYIKFFVKYLEFLEEKDRKELVVYLWNILATGNVLELRLLSLLDRKALAGHLGSFPEKYSSRVVQTRLIPINREPTSEELEKEFLGLFASLLFLMPNSHLETVKNLLSGFRFERAQTWKTELTDPF